jgi:hypothetical protein
MKGAPFVWDHGLTCKHSTRLERQARDKHFILFGLFVSDREDKMFLRLKFGITRLFLLYLTNIPNKLVCLYFDWLGAHSIVGSWPYLQTLDKAGKPYLASWSWIRKTKVV